MKFLIAPNAYKGTFTASEAIDLIQEVLQEIRPSATVYKQPLADGGDGTCSLLADAKSLKKFDCLSLNAIGQPTLGHFAWDESSNSAYMDVSTCSGIGDLPIFLREPTLASSYGTGLLIQQAILKGAKHLFIGLGGSATIDLGAGILQALGFLFLDKNGREIPAFSPDFLKRCQHIQRPLRLPNVSFTFLCDVRNLFFGLTGAVRIFGPQKGVEIEEFEEFEKVTRNFVDLLMKKSFHPVADSPGFGAAGGIALGLRQFFPSQLEFGAPYFFKEVNLENQVQQVDWIITGEGRYDLQSKEGKACFELMLLAQKYQKKIALITSGEATRIEGFDAVVQLPTLDFSTPNYKKAALKQFQGQLREAILKGLFID